MTETPDLTPQHDAVRRLLAEARHDEPTPPEVVARLETRLAQLQAERTAELTAAAGTAPVIDLGSRRRRLAAIGVMAAAAVVVAGVALGQVLPQGGSGSDSATSAESDAGAGTDTDTDLRSGGDDSGAGAALEPTSPEELSGKVRATEALPEVSLDAELDGALTSLRSQTPASSYAADAVVACRVGDVGRGRRVLVQVDGRPGLVIFRAPTRARQEADLFLCGDPEPLRTLSLPAP